MAHVNVTHTHSAGIADRISAIVRTLVEKNAQHRAYHRTMLELQSLSHHELTDLGLHRGDIRSVAYQSTYGK